VSYGPSNGGTAGRDHSRRPGPRWVDYHHRFAAPSTYVYEFVWDAGGEAIGPFCTDVDGNVLLDFTSHEPPPPPLGYNNPTIREKLRAFDPVDPLKIAGQDFYVSGGGQPDNPDFPGPTQLMDRLVAMTDHYDMDRVFLSNSGAEAVENAIKICYAAGGHRAITFDGAFHGRTLGALSLNRSKAVHRSGFPENPRVVSVPYPDTDEGIRNPLADRRPRRNVVADALHPERGVVDPEEVAYLILRVDSGRGRLSSGPSCVRPRPRGAARGGVISGSLPTRSSPDWDGRANCGPSTTSISRRTSLRAGRGFGWAQRSRARTSSRGRRVDSPRPGVRAISSPPCRACSRSIPSTRTTCSRTNVRERGAQFRTRLEDAITDGDAPGAIDDARGRGLMLAVEFDTKARRDAVLEGTFKRGLLTLGCGYKTLRLLPPPRRH